jgi:hypothetical protein
MAPRVREHPGTRPTERTLTVDERSVVHSGHHSPHEADEENPHFCFDGWVFLGYEGVDEDGELVEIFDRIPCRRCERERGDR